MDPAEILPLLLMMQILPGLVSGGAGDIASDNVVILPVAIGNLTISPGGSGTVLPIGVERDRRVNGRDRRDRPGDGGRRMSDQIRNMVFPIPPLSFLP